MCSQKMTRSRIDAVLYLGAALAICGCSGDGNGDVTDAAGAPPDAVGGDAEAPDPAEEAAEHGCIHFQTGPYVKVAAGSTADDTAPEVEAGHEVRQVTLVDVTGGKGGYLRLHVAAHAEILLALSKPIPVALTAEGGGVVAPAATPDLSAFCPAMVSSFVLDLEEGHYFVGLGPTPETQVDLLMEDLGGEHEPHADGFECTAARDGFSQCHEGKIERCHGPDDASAHFHSGTDCVALGLACVEIGESEALCIDMASACAEGESKCESGTAYNCVDGHLAVAPCDAGAECEVEGGKAHCHAPGGECGGHGHRERGACHCDEGYHPDPADTAVCLPDKELGEIACAELPGEPEKKAVTTSFGSVFADDYHADLDVPVEVSLPDGQESYIHFAVSVTGEYVFFLSIAGVLVAVLDKEQTEIALAGGVPAEKCPELIADHYHAGLTYTGDGSSPEPFVLRFGAGTAKTVRLLVKRKE